MNIKLAKSGTTLCVVISFLLGATTSSAQTLIHDDFSTAGTVGSNRTPSTTIEGRKYTRVVANNNANYTTDVIITGRGYASMKGNVAGAISIVSENEYIKPGALEISATFNINTITNNTPARTGRGIYLGFWSALPTTTDSMTNMYGVFVNPDGQLVLWQGGSSATNTTVATLAYDGTWDATAWHNMSYKIDIDGAATGNAGSIYDFVLDNKNYNWGLVTLFTNANTNYAGFGVSDSTGNGIGYFDNWTLSTISQVPEPSTYAALAGATALLFVIAVQRRRI
ncbi:PEP-CTERM putative exosortase interaction domain-containing protein [Opitutaceae bacterium TAV1]|nr:PEP-CTERM putative exosortase interaction domain-containing protein [Opitutaceae bacterium TAV1]